MKSIFRTIAIPAAALALTAPAATADEIQKAAAKVFEEQKDHTFSVSVTRKRGDADLTFDAQAISLDGEGLLVTALSAIEPPTNPVVAAAQQAVGGGAGDKGELSRLSIYAADGSEVDADLLLTDPDLDLAFIRVKGGDSSGALKFGKPTPASAKAALLDDVMGIQRLTASFQREASAALFEIAAVVESPQLLYVPSAGIGSGNAVFNLKGELLGVGARKGADGGVMPVIVPTETLLKLAAGVPKKAAE